MANLIEKFIKIIEYNGFKIAKHLVEDIARIGRSKSGHCDVKPVIGIHFHENCCLQNGEIVQFVNAQYCRRSSGWNHYCSGNEKRSVYLTASFLSTSCSAHTILKPTDHPKTKKCGIFIDFKKTSFHEFVQIKYHECFPLEPFSISSKDDDKTLSEHVLFSNTAKIVTETRNELLKWMHSNYSMESTKELCTDTEFAVAVFCSKYQNDHLYCYVLAQLCFDLKVLKLYKERDSEDMERNKRHKARQIMYIIQHRDNYVKSLYYHLINNKSTDFDHSKFISTTNVDEYQLFMDIKLQNEDRDKIHVYLSKLEWAQEVISMSAHQNKTIGTVLQNQEKALYAVSSNNINIYIYVMSNMILSMQLMQQYINNSKNMHNTVAEMTLLIQNRTKRIKEIQDKIHNSLIGESKRNRKEEHKIDTNDLYIPTQKKAKKEHQYQKKDRRYLEPVAQKYVQNKILKMRDTTSSSYFNVVYETSVPLCRIKQMRHNMLKSQKFKKQFEFKRSNKKRLSKAKPNERDSLYLLIKNKSHSFDWNS